MTLSGIVLGVVDILLVVAILVLIGAIVVWVLGMLKFAVPWDVQRIYLAVVALVALYMLVALIFGIPSIRLIGPVG